MEASPRILLKIFQPDIQYVVPIFQRRYVWNEIDQWAELWEDLLDVLDDVERVEALIDQGSEQPLPSHFLGAIVCDQSISAGSDIDERPLIDGQQRLTTLQLLLGVTLRLARAENAEQAVGLLSKLVENDDTLVEKEHETFKLWPSDPDREAFRAVMCGHTPPKPEHLIVKAEQFFKKRVSEWASDDPARRLTQLARVLRKNVELVVIDLQPGDNAQVIFESLNYGGRELTAIDLTKNLVFFQAGKKGIDPYQMYNEQWAPFDDEWWRKEVSQGRLKRARAELFLMHWLKLEKLEDVKAHRLYVEFRDLPKLKADLSETVAQLACDRDLYQKCDEQPDELPASTGGFFSRLEILDQSTPRPVALQLLRAVPDELDPASAARAFHALDSYMWRRALMRGSTANYNRMMLDLLKAVDENIARADLKIIELLAGLEGSNVRWPTDDELRADLQARGLYGTGRVGGVIRTALRLIENHWRAPKGEGPLSADNELQIEHILPQAWSDNWPLAAEPADTFTERELERRACVDRLGNLTLASPSLNRDMSNKEWALKLGHLKEHSNVQITGRYFTRAAWDEAEIRARADDLIDAIIEIWPGPCGEFTQPAAH